MLTDGGDLPWPDDAIEIGRIVDAWGVQGGFKVQPFSRDPQALFSSRRWFLQPPPAGPRPVLPGTPGTPALPRLLRITQAREHAGIVVANAQDITDRNGAEALRGARVFVPRGSFPTPAADEYYWVDLIGLEVVNREGIVLGQVADLIDTGASSVLRVLPSADAADATDAPGQATAKDEVAERLIPFVAAYVDAVDLKARRITVDA